MKRRRRLLGLLSAVLIAAILGLGSSSSSHAGRKASPSSQPEEPTARVAYHSQTGKLSFIGADPRRPIRIQQALGKGIAPAARAMAILNAYASEIGLSAPGLELALIQTRNHGEQRVSVRYQQVHEGVPILGGELIVNMDSGGQLHSLIGEISPDLAISTTPILTASEARSIALAAVGKWYGMSKGELGASDPELWILDERLLRWSDRPQELVWRVDVEPNSLSWIDELVLVNAETGAISLHFNQIDAAKDRETYDAGNTTALPGTLVCDEADPTCTGAAGDQHAIKAHEYSGDTYEFYSTYHGRDSIDDAGMTMISTVHYGTSYVNAFWNGSQMVYGDGAGFPLADDVVAHELTHGVTDYESNLYYYYQSGAINESLSDIWGELVDQTNGAGNDTAGVKWLMGEDVSGLGAIRDMADPPAFGDPDKMTSANYWTASSDNGGVHSNSGINNKAVYLMVDGGTFNGQTVTALGIAKTAAIYYRTQTTLLTSGSDYGDLYNALYQACLDLVGGVEGITSADCQEVRDATDAVEMNLEPSPGFNPEAEVCPGGGTPVDLFFDDLESGGGNWLVSSISGPGAWTLTSGYSHSGLVSLYANGSKLSSDSVTYLASDVSLPPGSNPYLWFAHAYDFEGPDWDGGWLEYSTDGGDSWSDAASLIDDGKAYDGPISTDWDNPNAGHNAFLDTSHGYVSSRLNLFSLTGQDVNFRWRMSTDSLIGDLGWLVDDVRIVDCGPVTPTQTATPFDTPTPTSTSTPTPTVTASPTWTSTPTATPTYAPNLVMDGGFEQGSPNPFWDELSVNFGSPLCTVAGCGNGGGTGAYAGNWWAWFGGVNGAVESSSVDQNVTIPAGSSSLSFWLEIPVAAGTGSDSLSAWIDGDLVWSVTDQSAGSFGSYDQVVIDVSEFGDCQPHNLLFYSQTLGIGVTNFFVDNVSLQVIDPTTFCDVGFEHWAWGFIESIFTAGLTAGYPDGTYQPDNPVTRAEMAVFLLKGIHGSDYSPPPASGGVFSDISGHWAQAWIERLEVEGVSSGYPDGTYRPEKNVTRAEMAILLLNARHGPGYVPPAPDGGSFADVSGHWAESWIEQLKEEGITSGYPGGNYRPENQVNRAEMAVFLVNAFDLMLP